MEAIRFETVIQDDGVVPVAALRTGERVEVIVLRLDPPASGAYPLRGTPARYDLPFEPAVPEAEWGAPRFYSTLTSGSGASKVTRA